MRFTDGDLARVKDGLAGPDTSWFDGYSVKTIKALLARLEAAEAIWKIEHGCEKGDSTFCCAQSQEAYYAWCEIKGE